MRTLQWMRKLLLSKKRTLTFALFGLDFSKEWDEVEAEDYTQWDVTPEKREQLVKDILRSFAVLIRRLHCLILIYRRTLSIPSTLATPVLP